MRYGPLAGAGVDGIEEQAHLLLVHKFCKIPVAADIFRVLQEVICFICAYDCSVILRLSVPAQFHVQVGCTVQSVVGMSSVRLEEVCRVVEQHGFGDYQSAGGKLALVVYGQGLANYVQVPVEEDDAAVPLCVGHLCGGVPVLGYGADISEDTGQAVADLIDETAVRIQADDLVHRIIDQYLVVVRIIREIRPYILTGPAS